MTPSPSDLPKHPAKFPDHMLPILADLAGNRAAVVMDPFAGVGKVLGLRDHGCFERFVLIELEAEWAHQAEQHPRWRAVGDRLYVQDCLNVMRLIAREVPHERPNLVVTSCTYGNRMADHHEAKDVGPDGKLTYRATYRHRLGRPLTAGNSGALQWGDAYRDFHDEAWEVVAHVLLPGGLFLLNVKDHIRKGVLVDVTGWHRDVVWTKGLRLIREERIPCPGMRRGANGKVRVAHESVLVFEKGHQ